MDTMIIFTDERFPEIEIRNYLRELFTVYKQGREVDTFNASIINGQGSIPFGKARQASHDYFDKMAEEIPPCTFVLTHEHKHGTDVKLFKSVRNMQDLLDDEELCDTLGVSYDPQIGESITIYPADITNIQEV
jgi:hypothetical protein